MHLLAPARLFRAGQAQRRWRAAVETCDIIGSDGQALARSRFGMPGRLPYSLHRACDRRLRHPRLVERPRLGDRSSLGPDARSATGLRTRWARRALRAAGDRDRRRRVRLRPRLPSAPPRPWRSARQRRSPLLALDGPVHGRDGRAGNRARPHPDVPLLRPHRGRFVLPDRLRSRPGRGARRGAHGTHRDGRQCRR